MIMKRLLLLFISLSVLLTACNNHDVVFVSDLTGASMDIDGETSVMTEGWLTLEYYKSENSWALYLKVQDYSEIVYYSTLTLTEFFPDQNMYSFYHQGADTGIVVTDDDCEIFLLLDDSHHIRVSRWPAARKDAKKIRKGIEKYCLHTGTSAEQIAAVLDSIAFANNDMSYDDAYDHDPVSEPKMTDSTSSPSASRQGQEPRKPVFDGYYTMTGVYQSGGQWFSTGITSLTYFKVYDDEMYEGKGTYAYQYVGNERLDDTVFRRYGTDNDNYFLVTYDGLVRWVSAFTVNYPMIGTVRTVNVNYYDRGDTRAAYSQEYNGGGSYSGSTSSSSTAPTGAGTHRCGLCDGKGWVPTDEGVTDFGSTAEKWCEDCRRYVTMSHWHKTCPSCSGKGVW